jgi:hypothetical protein
MPKDVNNVNKVWVCIYLSTNRGFLVYETPSGSKHASIILIDLDNQIYELVGSPRNFLFYRIDCYYDAPTSCGSTILIKVGAQTHPRSQYHLNVFELNSSFSAVDSHRIIVVPYNSDLFHSIDGRLIFNTFYSRFDGLLLKDFTIIEKDNSFIEIEDTGVHFKQEPLYHTACLLI